MIDDRDARGGEDSNVKRGTSHTVLTEIIILSSQWRGCTPGRVTEMGILLSIRIIIAHPRLSPVIIIPAAPVNEFLL